jgi:hypothetical protein
MHKLGRMPLSGGDSPTNRRSQTMQPPSLSACRAAAQFNHWLQATPDCAFLFFLAQWSGVPEPKRWVSAAVFYI